MDSPANLTGLREEVRVPGGNPGRHWENMQTPADSNPGPRCCEDLPTTLYTKPQLLLLFWLLLLRRQSGLSTNQKVSGLSPDSSSLHVEVSLSKVLNPEQLSMHPSDC